MNEIKVPQRAKWNPVFKIVDKLPQDGEWHRVQDYGFSVAEQTARNLNHPLSPWVFGFRIETNSDGELISVLYAKHVGNE